MPETRHRPDMNAVSNTHEEHAVDVLTRLAAEVADDPRVSGILQDSVRKLRARPCAPHWWRMPEVGDTHLTCGECDRRMSLRGDLNGHRAATILAGYERRHGAESSRSRSLWSCRNMRGRGRRRAAPVSCVRTSVPYVSEAFPGGSRRATRRVLCGVARARTRLLNRPPWNPSRASRPRAGMLPLEHMCREEVEMAIRRAVVAVAAVSARSAWPIGPVDAAGVQRTISYDDAARHIDRLASGLERVIKKIRPL